METRAHYVLIGAFALAGFFGIFAFFLWFAQLQLDRQFAYYDVDFPSVSGLGEASEVRFAGLPVGQVVDVRLSPANDGLVRVRLEIDASTPVRSDSLATIESLGVTGVAYVGIDAGTPEAPLLAGAAGKAVPRIQAGQSVLQSLASDAPEILAETLAVVRDLRQLLGAENQDRVRVILENVEKSSVAFNQALDDFSRVSGTVADFAREIGRFNTTLDRLTLDVSGALVTVGETLTSIGALAEDGRALLAEGSDTLAQANTVIASTDRYINDDLGPATQALGAAAAQIEGSVTDLSASAGELANSYKEAGVAATARLTEARETLAATDALIARIDAAFVTIDAAAERFDVLMAENAEPLIAELRVATADATTVIGQIGQAAETDLPAILEDVRTATRTASEVIENVGADLSSASARIDGLTGTAGEALETARETFARANETLTAINGAIVTGDRALAAAEKAFTGADRVINEDLTEAAGRLNSTLAELEATVGAVAEDIPAVTEDLRSASASAQVAFERIRETVDASAPGVREFAISALPQFGRLAVETRALIDNLDTLIEQVRRDPSRFFLDPRAPEYKR